MNPSARPSRISDQRLQRLCLWLVLTIARFAAPLLNTLAPRAASRMLRQYTEIARLLIVARAVKRVAFKAPRSGPIPEGSRRYTTRRVAGAALRRALRQDVREVLAEAERWIAHVTRRLQRGLTKLRLLPKPRRVRPIASVAAAFAPPLAADTS